MRTLGERAANEIAQTLLLAGELIPLTTPKIAFKLINKWAYNRNKFIQCEYNREDIINTRVILLDAIDKIVEREMELKASNLEVTKLKLNQTLEIIAQLMPHLK